MFPGSLREAKSHANVAASGGLFGSSAQDTTPHVFGSSPAFQAAMADPNRYLDVDVPSGMFGTTPRGTPTHAPARTSTTPLGDHPHFSSHFSPPESTFESHASGGLFGGESCSASTPATGAFGSSTPPGLFGESRVPHGSYRYNPTTGTLKASNRTGPEVTVPTSSFKETANPRTPGAKPYDTEAKKKTQFFATVEDESPFSSTEDTGKSNSNKDKATYSSPFTATPANTSKPPGSASSQFVLKKTDTQLPPPPVSMFTQNTSAGGVSSSSGPPPPADSRFTQSVLAGTFPPVTDQEPNFAQNVPGGAFPPMNVQEHNLAAAFRTAATASIAVPVATTVPVTISAGPPPPSVSAFISTPVSMFATATVPAQVAEPVKVERPAQQILIPAQQIPVKKTKSGGGLFDSVYAS